jgi:putrescine transport system substrate-binding protein
MREYSRICPGAAIVAVAVAAAVVAGCATPIANPPPAQPGPAPIERAAALVFDTDAEKVLTIYNWADYIDPRVLDEFTRQTGIQLRYENLDSNELLDQKLRLGSTGYDVVFPSGKFLEAQIVRGAYRKLDKSRLANLRNADGSTAAKLAKFDPGNDYAVNYLWGTLGIAFDADAIEAIMPGAPLDSYAMIWDPKVVSKFSRCGVTLIDKASEVVGSALIYLGKDPNSEKPEDLAAAERVMMAARPYIRILGPAEYFDQLVSGEVCLALSWSGDALQANNRLYAKGSPRRVDYRLPREGSIMFFDTMAIPTDAPHVKNAHLFIDYLLRPEVAATNSNYTSFASGNAAAFALIDPQISVDENFFPPPRMQEKLSPDLPESLEFELRLDRTWAKFRKRP